MPISRSYSSRRDADRSRRRLVTVALGLLAAALACQLWPKAASWRQSRLAAQLAVYAEQAPDGAARIAVRRIAECGLAGVDALVRLAGSPQAVAAPAAREALLNELAGWEMEYRVGGDPELFSRRLCRLAESLAGHAGRFEPDARYWAGGLAQQIVEHGDDLEARATFGVLRSCERVLALAPAVRPADALGSPLPATLGGDASVAEARPCPVPVAPPMEGPMAEAPQAAPAEPLRTAQASPRADINFLPTPPPITPARPTTPTVEAPPVRTDPSADDGGNPLRGPGAPRVVEAQPLPAPPRNYEASDEVVDVPSPAESRHLMRRYRQMSDEELAALLDMGTRYESLAVRHVLRERSRAEATATARRPDGQADTSPEKVLETLSRLSAAEGRATLRRLVVDADPEVRLKALAILATTDDPQLATILRQRAMEDSDPRVTELAARILKERK